ncbi:polysaccharide biosynthesis/export family protein [Paraburkholderia sp. RL17-381-BIF-C]
MRMERPPSIANSAIASNPTEAQLSVPIIDIDLSLIKKIRESNRSVDLDSSRLESAGGSYKIGAGDVLQITVWDHPELAAALGGQPQAAARPSDAPPGFVVDDAGYLVFPYAGRIHVAGLRPEQVQAILSESFTKAFRDPQVTVRVASFRSQRVYVEGEVHAPGTQVINDIQMNLVDAISRAGGFSSTADQSHVELKRKSITTVIDMSSARSGKLDPSQIVLKDGDVLRIPSRDEFGVFVMGEVNKPVTAIPRTTGSLSLSEALAQAGSLNSNSADAAQLYVVRGSLDGAPEVFHLDARSPVAMVLANEFPLKPKDIVYVDGNGLVRFNRVLTLLLPAINAGLTAAIVTK